MNFFRGGTEDDILTQGEWCPCGKRVLVEFNENGSINLAAKAGVSYCFAIPPPEVLWSGGKLEGRPEPGTAVCERFWCKVLRRA